jgi:hypothetical protein
VVMGGKIPFTAEISRPFYIDRHLRALEIRRKKGSGPSAGEGNDGDDIINVVTIETQLDYWEACHDLKQTGWTGCVAGQGSHLSITEPIAATLAAFHMAHGQHVVWVNVDRLRAFDAHDVNQLVDPGLVIITGLRWESYVSRWEKAFEVLRTSYPTANRLVVASGAHPLAVMNRLGMPVNRAFNLSASFNPVEMV